MMTQGAVLVADDSSLFRASMRAIIELMLPAVCVLDACNGAEVLEVAHCSSPDVILLDLYLPPLSSHEIAVLLRSSPKTRDIFIVLMTNPAFNLAPDQLALYQAVLPKPFPIKLLINCIKEKCAPARLGY